MASDSISDRELEGFDPILVSKYFIFVLPCKYSLSATCYFIVERLPSTSATSSFHNVVAIHLSILLADIDQQ
jgi:hypothetical protein